MTDGSPSTRSERARAYVVHVYTASGIVPAFLAATEIASAVPSPPFVFVLLALAGVIDATDGPLARRWEVEVHAPTIHGRTLDDIVDYLNFTFLPLMLVWRMEWLAPPASLWIVVALMASLFGFANAGAKDEERGVFLGFPSYWNVVAFYLGIFAARGAAVLATGIVVALAFLTLVPFPFVYPNRAPAAWKRLLAATGVVWLGWVLWTLPSYPHASHVGLALSFGYPGLHVAASLWMARHTR